MLGFLHEMVLLDLMELCQCLIPDYHTVTEQKMLCFALWHNFPNDVMHGCACCGEEQEG